MNPIKPFSVFEGLLKPRDINSRKEAREKELANRIAFTRQRGEQLTQEIKQSLQKTNLRLDTYSTGSHFFINDTEKYLICVLCPSKGPYSTAHHIAEVTIIQNINDTYSLTIDDYLTPKQYDNLTKQQLLNNIAGTVLT